jgi:hypothetical protein
MDDIDSSSSTAQLGKYGFADLRLTPGFATGPVLYTTEEFPELEAMIGRWFGGDGDVETREGENRIPQSTF